MVEQEQKVILPPDSEENKKRIQDARWQLHPLHIFQSLYWRTKVSDWRLSRIHTWNSESAKDDVNILARFHGHFSTLKEFDAGLRLHRQFYRSYNPKLDSEDYPDDRDKYISFKVFRLGLETGGGYAVGSRFNEEGNFCVDIILDPASEKELIQEGEDYVNKEIVKTESELKKLQQSLERIQTYKQTRFPE